MTTKKITLNNKTEVTEISKGTVLKRNGDLFMVTEVVREHIEDPIHDALFLSNPPKPWEVRRTRVEGKYSLTSLSTGSNYFLSAVPLVELLRKIREVGKFEVVEAIEFKEV
jgi:hypothetical protein